MAKINDFLLQGIQETQVEDEMWYLDTSVTNHMTDKKRLLCDFDDSLGSVVKFGDGSNIDISVFFLLHSTWKWCCKKEEHNTHENDRSSSIEEDCPRRYKDID
ncbi:unnamed protein product [Spirodela intermedia]|uniref:Retrovirus-related Pol polyprotein from transposon TNT 1-94-like beta-barrel domain-containing protein n=1 Tax=Spirodela intermedia TaxID=51605 RepID=A0A7I8K4C7_SPIIN|nr:unnamed protein product [Spirodela intermedia]